MTTNIYFNWISQVLTTLVVYIAICLIFVWIRQKKSSLFHEVDNQTTAQRKIPVEIALSSQLLIINSSVILFVYFLKNNYNISPVYFDIQDYGWFYFFLSIFLLTLVSDATFYWLHRAMHIPFFYNSIHHVHHRSTNPTAFTGFSFHTLEAASIGFICFYLPALIVPWHPIAFMIYSVFCVFWISFIHSGVEFQRSPSLYKIMNTSSDHNAHHQYTNYNYSLYYSIWDRLCKTYRKEK